MKDLNSKLLMPFFQSVTRAVVEGLVPTEVNLSSNIFKFLFLCK